MKKKKKQSDIRLFYAVKSNRGLLRKNPQNPSWTDNLLYTKLYAKRGTAQGMITKYRKSWLDVDWASVAELKLTYVGTIDEITEREFFRSDNEDIGNY